MTYRRLSDKKRVSGIVYSVSVTVHLPEETARKIKAKGSLSVGIRQAVENAINSKESVEPRHIEQSTSITCDVRLSHEMHKKLRDRYPYRGGVKRAIQAMAIGYYDARR
jgi:D-aminopeptidase